jgi:hypothetical protein
MSTEEEIVITFVPPLSALLARAENEKGSSITVEEAQAMWRFSEPAENA